MMNLSISHAFAELKSRLNLKRILIERAAKKSPAAFRNNLKWTDSASQATVKTDSSLPDSSHNHSLPEWQKKDFEKLDALCLGLVEKNPNALKRAYLERPRGHSKTTDLAVMVAWLLQFSARPLEGIIAAADRDQASLLKKAIERIVILNPDLCGDLDCFKDSITNRKTGSRLNVISSDVKSSWGILPDFVICDELCHWDHPDMWYSLLSSAVKKPECVLVVLSNAGVGTSWQFQAREAARNNSQWYFSHIQGVQAPWISPEGLEEQKRLLPRGVFDRLWQNIWQDSDGEFVTLKEAEACRDQQLESREAGHPDIHYVAGVDFASSRDHTVGVVAHLDKQGVMVIDRMDVETPRADKPVSVKWVKNWMIEMNRRFPDISFILDEYQLLSVIQDLGDCLDIEKFQFAGLKGHHQLAMTLQRRIRDQQIRWYERCGQLPLVEERNDLETELSSVLLKQFPNGMVRINHKQDGIHHDDRVFALGMTALKLESSNSSRQWLTMDHPNNQGDFDWETL